MIRLHHVNVLVAPGHTQDVVAFYELLGLRRATKSPDVSPLGAWFDLPGGRNQVHVSEREGTMHPEQHFALVTDDLDGLAAALQAAGHPWSFRKDVSGARRGETRDPAGNMVELVESVGPFA